MPYTTEIDAEDLMAGDVILYCALHVEGETPNDPVELTVLRDGEPWRDMFGREMKRYWCRGHADKNGKPSDDAREGFMTYGPGARVTLRYR
jgi:hypothetical protein